jgi:hypothetical protein
MVRRIRTRIISWPGGFPAERRSHEHHRRQESESARVFINKSSTESNSESKESGPDQFYIDGGGGAGFNDSNHFCTYLLKGAEQMKNVDMKVEGNILTVKVDLSKTFGRSSTGKSEIIASTEGNQAISPGVFMGLNIYKK